MSEEWVETTLEQVCRVRSSKRVLQKDWQNSGVPFYRGREISSLAAQGFVAPDLHIEQSHFERLAASSGVPLRGDLLITAIGTIGNTYVIPNETPLYFKDASVLWVSPSSSIESWYLKYWFASAGFWNQVVSGNGTTVDTLTISALSKMTISIPPLPVQRRIVDLMTHLDSHLANMRAEREALAITRKVMLTDALAGQLADAPMNEEWVETTLGELAIWRGGMTPSMANPSYWSGGDIPWVSSKEVVGGVLLGTEKHVTPKAVAETSLRLIPAGSVVVVVRSGILLHTFPVAYVPFATTVNQDVKVAVPVEGVDGQFLAYLLESESAEILQRYRKTGTTVQSIGVPSLLDHLVLCPPHSIQRHIVESMVLLDAQAGNLSDEVRTLTVFRASLLSNLLSRGLEVASGYDSLLSKVA